MKILIPLLILFFAINAFGQDSTNKNTGIITKKTFGPYRIDGNRISQREFKTELYKVPAAIPYYKKAKSNEIGVYAFLGVTGVFVFLSNRTTRYGYTGPAKNQETFLISALIAEATSIYFYFRSSANMKRAIRLRNENLKLVY